MALVAPTAWRTSLRGRIRLSIDPEFRGRVFPLRAFWGGDDYRQHVFWFPGWWRTARAFRPDIIHVDAEPYSVCALQFGLLSRRSGSRFLFRGAQTLVKKLPPPFRWIERMTFRWADSAHARSNRAGQVLAEKGFTRPVHIIGHSVDISAFTPGEDAQLQERLRAVGPVALYLGRLSEEKGVEDFIRAVARLRDWGRTVTAVIVGSGPEETALGRRIADWGLQDLVRMMPAVPHGDVVSYYRVADVVVVPSRTTAWIVEQFGRTIIEALACGKPVIGSSAGEVPRLLERTGGGVVFREGDIEDLARCLAALLGDPTRSRALADHGRAAVRQMYSTQAEAAQLKRMYDGVMSGSRVR